MKKTDWSKVAAEFNAKEPKRDMTWCNACVHKDNSWFENPCYRCGEDNNYFHFEEVKDETKQVFLVLCNV